MENNILKNANIPKETSKRKFIILTVILIVLIIGIVVGIVVTNSTPSLENTGGVYEISYEKNDDYSEMLNLYNNLWNETSEDRLMEILEKGGIDKSYLQINGEGEDSYISAVPIDSSADYSGENIEYISFSYIPSDDESSLPSIDDIVYHNYHDGEYDYIYESSDGEFTHYSDGLTNTYEDKTSAIDSYLMEL